MVSEAFLNAYINSGMFNVLILVLVEDGLGVFISQPKNFQLFIVLILVLVEDGLGDRQL